MVGLMRIAFSLICAVVVSLLAGCATQPKAPKKPATLEERFKRADADSDGKVSRDEFTDFMIEDVFARYDRNGDGFVDEAEYVAGGGSPENFRKINISGTGKITLQEAKASKLIRDTMVVPFDEADVNGSGYVTWDEFVAFRKRAQPYIR